MSQCSPTCLGCFSFLQFFCLFVCLLKRIAEVVGNDLTLPMSAKCGFFTASLGLFFDELLCTLVIKTHLTFSLFISLFLFIFRLLLLWVLAAAFITATVDVSIYVTLLSRANGENKGCTVWLSSPAALFIIKCKSPWHTLTSPASFHSSNITDTTTTWVGFFFSSTSSFQSSFWGFLDFFPPWVFSSFFLFCFSRHRILIFGENKKIASDRYTYRYYALYRISLSLPRVRSLRPRL